jgi:2-C-methyl-D-erythritol 4-phosphate cytidylyltransferase
VPRRPTAALVLLAAGNGQRAGHATNKVFLPLAGRRVFTWSLDWTAHVAEIGEVVLVVRESDTETARAALARESPRRAVEIVSGGTTRHESEFAGLRALRDRIRAGVVDVVVVHDAARPLTGSAMFRDVIEVARARGGALPGRPAPALLTSDGGGDDGDGRSHVVAVQTPQAFRAGPLLDAYELADRAGFSGSDTSSCVEQFGSLDITYLPGTAHNIKITFPEDLFVAERLLARTGFSLLPEPGER